MQHPWTNHDLWNRKPLALWAGGILVGLLLSEPAAGEKACGPLRVHPTNPRYFTDGAGRAAYLTGSHTWGNLSDFNERWPPFDFPAYLDFLERHHHNFTRLWHGSLTTSPPTTSAPARGRPWTTARSRIRHTAGGVDR